MNAKRTPAMLMTGLALVVLPLLGLAFKTMSFGWFMVFLVFGPIFVLAAGYVFQIVIAAQGFLASEPLFANNGSAGSRARSATAAWASTLAFVVLGIFMPDGGDSAWGSTFQGWLGVYDTASGSAARIHEATDSLTAIIATVAAAIWIGGFLWLCIEWVLALVRRRDMRRYAAANPGTFSEFAPPPSP